MEFDIPNISIEVPMKPTSVLLIVNPVSGRMKSKTGLFEILDELYRFDAPLDESALGSSDASDDTETVSAEENLPSPGFGRVTPNTLGGELDPDRRVTVVPTMYRGHATQLASSASREGFDTVICCGGDGTLNETVTGLLTIPAESRPMLGYIPAGSTNDFAASLGLPTTLRGAARAAVSQEELPIDIGRFSPIGHESLPVRYFSYIASFGIFTAASYSTPQSVKNVFGHLAYVFEGAKDLTNIHPHHAVFDLADGTRLEGDYVFGAVSNTTSAGGIVKLPADEVSMSDGALEVFLVHNPRNLNDLNKITGALMSGNLASCPLIEFHHTPAVTVTLDKPLRWSLDGEESLGGTKMDICCLPAAVHIKRQSR